MSAGLGGTRGPVVSPCSSLSDGSGVVAYAHASGAAKSCSTLSPLSPTRAIPTPSPRISSDSSFSSRSPVAVFRGLALASVASKECSPRLFAVDSLSPLPSPGRNSRVSPHELPSSGLSRPALPVPTVAVPLTAVKRDSIFSASSVGSGEELSLECSESEQSPSPRFSPREDTPVMPIAVGTRSAGPTSPFGAFGVGVLSAHSPLAAGFIARHKLAPLCLLDGAKLLPHSTLPSARAPHVSLGSSVGSASNDSGRSTQALSPAASVSASPTAATRSLLQNIRHVAVPSGSPVSALSAAAGMPPTHSPAAVRGNVPVYPAYSAAAVSMSRRHSVAGVPRPVSVSPTHTQVLTASIACNVPLEDTVSPLLVASSPMPVPANAADSRGARRQLSCSVACLAPLQAPRCKTGKADMLEAHPAMGCASAAGLVWLAAHVSGKSPTNMPAGGELSAVQTYGALSTNARGVVAYAAAQRDTLPLVRRLSVPTVLRATNGAPVSALPLTSLSLRPGDMHARGSEREAHDDHAPSTPPARARGILQSTHESLSSSVPRPFKASLGRSSAQPPPLASQGRGSSCMPMPMPMPAVGRSRSGSLALPPLAPASVPVTPLPSQLPPNFDLNLAPELTLPPPSSSAHTSHTQLGYLPLSARTRAVNIAEGYSPQSVHAQVAPTHHPHQLMPSPLLRPSHSGDARIGEGYLSTHCLPQSVAHVAARCLSPEPSEEDLLDMREAEDLPPQGFDDVRSPRVDSAQAVALAAGFGLHLRSPRPAVWATPVSQQALQALAAQVRAPLALHSNAIVPPFAIRSNPDVSSSEEVLSPLPPDSCRVDRAPPLLLTKSALSDPNARTPVPLRPMALLSSAAAAAASELELLSCLEPGLGALSPHWLSELDLASSPRAPIAMRSTLQSPTAAPAALAVASVAKVPVLSPVGTARAGRPKTTIVSSTPQPFAF